jgi:hypothetical protein
MQKVLYHYTTFGYLEKIVESGFLKVSQWEKKNNIKRRALWLTKNPNWDNTATKGYYDKNIGKSRSLSFEDQSNMFGCIRITIPYSRNYCNWETFKRVSKEPLEICNQLEIIGIKKGINPDDWHISFHDVSTTEIITVHYWNGNEWEDIVNEENELLTTKAGDRKKSEQIV